MRISGLSSGIDTESLIEELMNAERIPVDRLYQQKVKTEWQRDAYRDVNSRLLQLRTAAFDMRLQASYSARQVSSSNESIVSATATGKSVDGSFSIKVNKLAEPARFYSGEITEDEAQTFFDGLINANVDEADEAKIAFQGLNDEPVEIEITGEDTLESVLAKISNNKDLGLSAYYDSHAKKVVISTKETGENAKITFLTDESDEKGKAFLTEVLGVEGEDKEGELILAQGSNAALQINGLDTERESNTFDLNGTTITLHDTSETVVRLTVSQDVDAVYDRIKEFVDLYNEIIGDLNVRLREPVNREYAPLTDAEKDAMSDKDIERWEEAAKSGLLRSDRLISGILSDMRMAISQAGLSEIGITTGSWQEYGQLHIDENTLKEALSEDLEGVTKLFTSADGEGNNTGLAAKLTDLLDDGMENIVSTAGKKSIPYDQSYLGEQIRRFESRLDEMEDRLIDVENRYWRQFTAMERALSELYAQSDWLYQQLTALQG